MSVSFHDEARDELQTAFDFYDRVRPQLANDFLSEVKSRIRLIERDPESWPVTDVNIRRARVPHFPYDLLFAVTGNAIEIIAVAHHHRRPGYWRRRRSR